MVSIPKGFLAALSLVIPPPQQQQQYVNMAMAGLEEIRVLEKLISNKRRLMDGVAQRLISKYHSA